MKLEHLNLNSKSETEINREALYQLFPSCFVETKDEKTGKICKVVDFDRLNELIGGGVNKI